MKRIALLLISTLTFTTLTYSQDKTFTMADAVINQYSTLAPERINQLQWVKNSTDYSFVKKQAGGDVLVKGNPESKTLDEVVTLEYLNQELKRLEIDTLAGFPHVYWDNGNQFHISIKNTTYNFDIKKHLLSKGKEIELPKGASNKETNPKGSEIAFTVDNNLFLYKDGKPIAITNEENEGIISGQAVHRFEFGISKGIFWSPEGNFIAFYRMDETMVTDYPVIDFTVRPAKNKDIKYPMAGDTSHQVTIGVYNIKTGKTTFLETGKPRDKYLTNVAWSPDEKSIYVAELNRGQDHMKLNGYNVATGKPELTLFEEKSGKYVEPLNPVAFVPQNPDLFVWQSERDGFNHLYLYNTSGKLIRQLTKGEWVVTESLGFSPDGTTLFYMSTETSPLNRDLYSVNIKTGKTSRLTKDEGTHYVSFNDNYKYFIDHFQSIKVPREIRIITNTGKEKKELLKAEDPLKEYQLGEMDIFTIENKEGDELYCRMFKPVDFDDDKKYPVIVYLYGGPHLQLIRNSWLGGANLWYQYLAQNGFIVFSLDNRGSDARGRDFEQAIHRQLGTVEMEDQMAGVEYLKSLDYVDTTRMGIHGWSFGGFMTISMMTRNPGAFKVGVAGGPVIDWNYYEVMYTERYMDTPQENPEGYKANNLMNYVGDLQGNLLLIHGTSDDVVVWQHSLLYLDKAVEEGVQVDYFVYPGHKHNVYGKDRIHLMSKVTEYLTDHLK